MGEISALIPKLYSGTEDGIKDLQQRLRDLYLACTQQSDKTPRSIILEIRGTSSSQPSVRTNLRDVVSKLGGMFFIVDCQQPAFISFWPLRSLLEQLLPIVHHEAPQLLADYAPEIQALHPSLATQLEIRPQFPLSQIALTPSERRSHRESEQAFRIINGVCQLIIETQQVCPSLAHAPLLIWWENLQLADRGTMLTFRRLNRWSAQAHLPIMTVGVRKAQQLLSVEPPPSLTPKKIVLLDWSSEHEQLWQDVRSQLIGEFAEIEGPDSAEEIQQRAFPPSVSVEEEDGEAYLALTALRCLREGKVEEGVAYALQVIRQALFMLNLEEVFFFAGYIIPLLETQYAENFDMARFTQTWEALIAKDLYAALEFSLSGLDKQRDVLIATWKAVALAHAFLAHHATAVQCYQIAFDIAETASMKAQLCMYLGLITGKRLHNIEQSQTYIQQGFQTIEGMSDMIPSLERGWLLNVNALMNYQSKRFRDSMTMVQSALTTVKGFHHSEATHLKVNLISNISVLYEGTGRVEQALHTWSFFQDFLAAANEIFAKHYLFREGGLHVKLQHYEEALRCYGQSFTQAEQMHDFFHGEIIARACGYVTYQQASFQAAFQWYGRSVAFRKKIGDLEHLPISLLSQALCAFHLTEYQDASLLAHEAYRYCTDLQIPCLDVATQILRLLEMPSSGQEMAAEARTCEERIVLPPSTKLNRPFYLMNLYPEGAH